MSVLPDLQPELAAQDPAAAPSVRALRAATYIPTGSTPWAVLMCKFSDVADQPQALAFFADFLTTAGDGKGGMADYWRDMSGGAVTLDGSAVFGWFTLGLSLETAKGWTWPGARIDLMRACVAAADGAVDLSAFQGVIAVLNAQIDSGSSGRRELQVGSGWREFGLVNLDPGAWNNAFAAHEMGHGYGLPHSFSDEPTVMEYGDGWDIMSAMTFGGKFPTFIHPVFGRSGPALCGVYRDRLGWIPSSERLDLSSFGPGATLTISALDKAPPGIRLVRIWLGFSTQYYAVELRMPRGTGWDQGIDRAGVLVRRVQNGVSYLRQSTSGIQDMQPGDSFIDAHENLAVSVLGFDAKERTATVHIGPRPPVNLITRAALTPLPNAAGWHNSDVEVRLTGTAAVGSGATRITYSATGADAMAPATVTGPAVSVTVTKQGSTTLCYAAEDNTGAGELPRTLRIDIDKTRPKTTRTVTSPAPGQVDIELNGADPSSDASQSSGFKSLTYEAVGANPLPPTTSTQPRVRLSITAPGQTTVFYWSTDRADNTEGPHTLDLRPVPQVTPDSLTFVAVPGTVSAPQTLLLRNLGETTLAISGIDTTDSAFALTHGSLPRCGNTLAPGATCAIDIMFAPPAATVHQAALLLSTDFPDRTIEIPLTGTGVRPRLEFSPARPDGLTFPATRIGHLSPPRTVTLRNAGPVPLTITDVVAGDDFFVVRTGCAVYPRTLAPGQSCDVDVAVRPRGPGPRTGALAVESNAEGGRQLLPLTGEGIAEPELTAVPAALSFGPQPAGTAGTPQWIELTNTGHAELRLLGPSFTRAHAADFSITDAGRLPDAGVDLEPERSTRVQVAFRPADLGPRAAQLLLATNVPGPAQGIPVSGVGVAAPAVVLDPTSIDFGPQPVGTPGPTTTVTLLNNSPAPVEIRTTELTGGTAADFAVTSAPGDTCGAAPIPAGGSCRAAVTFTPAAVGSRSSVLALTDAAGLRYEVPLSGTGSGALITFEPATLDFGALPPGGTERRDLTIRSTGNAVLVIDALQTTGDFLNGPGCVGGLRPGRDCMVRVVFRPTGEGPRTGELTVTSNAVGGPYRLPLTGTGLVPAIGITPDALTFGAQDVGTTSRPQPVTVSSTGSASLSITEVTLTGPDTADFRLQDSCGWQRHMPGTQCVVEVVFAPTAPGPRTATLTLTDDAPGSPHTVQLSGEGHA
ncbi:choice-of-anchor D domain-containing protein [Streptomyces sp. R35]|uniref:Choice-of-anchor D domain-containing protein n=1 Tax=Streptomyces sp. R35 TaxID=3238630 RepID=A0AB39SP69_9ACTN